MARRTSSTTCRRGARVGHVEPAPQGAPGTLASRPRVASTCGATFRRDCKSSIEGKYDAIVLAAAGLQRLGLEGAIGAYLPRRAVPARRRSGRARGRAARRRRRRPFDGSLSLDDPRRAPRPRPSARCSLGSRAAARCRSARSARSLRRARAAGGGLLARRPDGGRRAASKATRGRRRGRRRARRGAARPRRRRDPRRDPRAAPGEG